MSALSQASNRDKVRTKFDASYCCFSSDYYVFPGAILLVVDQMVEMVEMVELPLYFDSVAKADPEQQLGVPLLFGSWAQD